MTNRTTNRTADHIHNKRNLQPVGWEARVKRLLPTLCSLTLEQPFHRKQDTMKTARTLVTRAAAAIGLALAFAMPAAQAQSFVQVRDWDVFVDLPTGFAYVKTPIGWRFVRQLDEEQMARLPASTLTALLPPEQPEILYAHPALEPSPRVLAMRALDRRLAGAATTPAQQQ